LTQRKANIERMNTRLINADCRDALTEIQTDSIDCVITDPPYGISFLNIGWDKEVPPVSIWQEVYRLENTHKEVKNTR
jgi:DNA modification methylase